jgi:hypothetical protein
MSSRAAPAPGTVRALQSALAAEHAAVYGYGVVGAHLTGSQQVTATTDWVAHQVARDRLEAMLRSLGSSQPTAAAVAYQLPVPVRNAREAVALAVVLEDRIATAYLGLVALSNRSRRPRCAQRPGAGAPSRSRA